MNVVEMSKAVADECSHKMSADPGPGTRFWSFYKTVFMYLLYEGHIFGPITSNMIQ